jgi:hypothetical protein
MTTPTLPELRANDTLTMLLRRTVRIQREYVDHSIALWEEPECVAMKDQWQANIHSMRALVEQLGADPKEAKQLVRKLMGEWNTNTNSIQQRSWMNIEEAMST